MWKEYEKKLYETLRQNYPDCEIEYNDSIYGIYSITERQIDFSIRGNLAGKRILGIVDTKYYNKNINVKIVESFIGMTEDVNANFGFIITNKGYSKAAKNRVKHSNLKLDVLELNELNEIDITIDYFFNQNIKGLQLSKYEFFRRWKQNTNFFDSTKSNYKKRIVCFKEGFANTEYYAFKKILENSARAFRDFNQLDYIKIYIPSNKNNQFTNYFDVKTLYFSTIKKTDIEDFTNTNIEYLRDDIKNWRNEFLGKLNKERVMEFASKFIQEKKYDEYKNITCS
ncbi:restriction endonuclease [Winogradskyella thalassocola]|uniref:Restriction endonuclease n=1 Tax=Winogradskyella thalassocola TaxID=262004 RepID=A0A1G8M8M7_9FLAO|nr:restriction endonuclease [Winogradskyella thalassocola]SDI64316.1 Restriction endonuclease [Winogradskyella thalassocola]